MLRSPTGDRLGEVGEENAGKKPKKRPPCLPVPINCGTWLDEIRSGNLGGRCVCASALDKVKHPLHERGYVGSQARVGDA
jgi:hypothetical protein